MKRILVCILTALLFLSSAYNASAENKGASDLDLSTAETLFSSMAAGFQDLIDSPGTNFASLAMVSFSTMEGVVAESRKKGLETSFLNDQNDNFYRALFCDFAVQIVCNGLLYSDLLADDAPTKHSHHAAKLVEALEKYISISNISEYTDQNPEEVLEVFNSLSSAADIILK